jgi:hypothetical protein
MHLLIACTGVNSKTAPTFKRRLDSPVSFITLRVESLINFNQQTRRQR